MPYDVTEAPGAAAETAGQVPIPRLTRAAVGAARAVVRTVPCPMRTRPSAAGGGATTTYYYRTSLGVYGSTTSLSSIPAGATLLNRVTT